MRSLVSLLGSRRCGVALACSRSRAGRFFASASASAQRKIAPKAAAALQNLQGFQPDDGEKFWHLRRDEAVAAACGARPLVATSYWARDENRSGEPRAVKKFSFFESYKEYHSYIQLCRASGQVQGLDEMLLHDQERVLYFDLDCKTDVTSLKAISSQIVEVLSCYVQWFFLLDKPATPVVLWSEQAEKFSVHVLFPEIQFPTHAHQMLYLPTLVQGMRLVEGKFSFIRALVDPFPYNKTQFFRGPYAAKLRPTGYDASTALIPGNLFRGDPLTPFIGYCNPDYKLELPTLSEIVSQRASLHRQARMQRDCVGSSDDMVLWDEEFVQNRDACLEDLRNMHEVDQFAALLPHLHPLRASHYWSWFRVAGVAARLMKMYPALEEDVWQAFETWSQQFPRYCPLENRGVLDKAAEKEGLPTVKLVEQLASFDNTQLEIRLGTREDVRSKGEPTRAELEQYLWERGQTAESYMGQLLLAGGGPQQREIIGCARARRTQEHFGS